MSKFLLPLLIFITQFCFGQSPDSYVKLRNPNLVFLEHLVKTKLDSVRQENGIHPLANDSLLYVAARDHAEYCAKSDKSTHHEVDKNKETPEARVRYYGGKNYFLDELLGDVYIHTKVQKLGKKAKPGDKVELKTYGAVANYIVYKWTHNTQIYNKIINPKHVTIGCAIKLNRVNDHMMVVCMLGKPYLKYHFTEYKRFFPYSSFEMYEVPNDFRAAKNVPSFEYPQKLKVATSKSVYEDYQQDFEDIQFQVIEERGGVYLQTRDIDQIKRIFEHHKNGLILELVDYEQYHCGNPDYFMRPSKRNGKSVFSGTILNPKFGELILNGINEKRKVWKLFMGQIPHVAGYYEWNVWLIANKKISIKKHFDSFTGNPLALFTPLELKPDFRKEPYDYHFHFDTLNHEIPLDKGEFNFTSKDIHAINDAINTKTENYAYTKIDLTFYQPAVPLRGSMPEKYKEAQKSLIDTLKKTIYTDIKISQKEETDWDKLDKLIEENQDSALMNVPREELSDMLKQAQYGKKYADELWNSLYVKFDIIHYHDTLQKLFEEYHHQLDFLASYEITDTNLIVETEKLQHTILDYAIDVEADPNPFIKISHIAHKPELARIMNNQAWYEYTYIYQHKHNEEILKEFYDKLKYIATEIKNPDPKHIYNHFAFSVNHWGIHTYDKDFKSSKIKAEFKKLTEKKGVGNFKEMEEALDIKAAHYYHQFGKNEKAMKLMDEMVDGIDRLYSTSNDLDTLSRLASTLLYYGRSKRAFQILEPLMRSGGDNKDGLKIYLKLAFEHVPPDPDDINYAYYLRLMAADEELGRKDWCDLFVGPHNISFQAFEYEPLRKKYCEVCGGSNYATKY